MGAVVKRDPEYNPRFDFEWVLKRARKKYPRWDWALAHQDYGFSWVIFGCAGEYRNAVYLAHAPDDKLVAFNINDIVRRDRTAWVDKALKQIVDGAKTK